MRRPDEGHERKVAGNRKLAFRIGHFEKAAKLGELLLDRPASVDGAVDLDFNVAGTRFAGIAVNQPTSCASASLAPSQFT